MIRNALLALCLAAMTWGDAGAGILHPRAPDFAAKYQPFTYILSPSSRRLVYGSYRGTLHLLENRQGNLVEKLARDLWSPVLEIVAADLDGDKQEEVVGFTQDSRLFVLKGTDLQDIWNTQLGRFQSITALTVADVDGDEQPEILMIADGLLRIFSGMRDTEEWKGSEPYTDSDLAVGDVDGDGKLEIVGLGPDGLDRVFDVDERRVKWN